MSDTPETDKNVSVGLENADRECVPVDFCRKLERERDEVREEVKELIYIAERAIDLAEIDFENDKFGVVSELRDGMERIKERAKCFVCTPEQKCWECADDTSLKERAK
jgi:hypothetical protein